MRVTAAGDVVEGGDTAADGLKDGIAGLLQWLGEPTGDAYEGDQQLALVANAALAP